VPTPPGRHRAYQDPATRPDLRPSGHDVGDPPGEPRIRHDGLGTLLTLCALVAVLAVVVLTTLG
jgi:hypothetical protein